MPAWAPAAVAVAGLVAAAVFYLREVARQWFVLDEFDYLGPDPGQSRLGWLISPHNEHTILFTKAWFSSLVEVIGLDHYWVYGVPLILGLLLAVAAIYVLARMAVGNRGIALGVAVMVLFLGSAVGTLTWAGQMQFTLSIAAGLWALVAAIALPRRAPLLLLGLSVFGALNGSAYLTFGLTAGFLLVLRRQWVAAACAAAPPVLWTVFARAVWDIDTPNSAEGLKQIVQKAPGFVGGMVELATSRFLMVPGLGVPLLIVAAVGTIVVLSRPDAALRTSAAAQVVLALAVALVATLGVVVMGRLNLGDRAWQGGGYSLLIMSCLVPLLGILVAQAMGRSARGVVAFCVVAVLLAGLGAGFIRIAATDTARWKATGKALLTTAASFTAERVPAFPGERPAPQQAPTVSLATLDSFVERGWLSPAAGSVDVRDQALLNVQVRAVAAKAAPDFCTAQEAVPVPPRGRVLLNLTVPATGEITATEYGGDAVRAIRAPAGPVAVESLSDSTVVLRDSRAAIPTCP